MNDRRLHAHRADFDERPRVSSDDVRALLWLIAFAVILIGATSVNW
jgi:hypothetical protein